MLNKVKPEDVEALRRVRQEIPQQRLIDVLNHMDVDYRTWTDLDMYIYYLDNKLDNYEIE